MHVQTPIKDQERRSQTAFKSN